MKREKIIIAGLLIALMTFIQACGLTERISYENKRKQIYISANASDMRASGLFFPSVLESCKNAGINLVTVSPKTVADYEAIGKLSAITYSSLSINEDPVSASVLTALSPYGLSEKSTVVLSTDTSMTEYLRKNLTAKYPQNFFIETVADELTSVFAFPQCEDKNIVIGYDEEELYLINAAGMTPCFEYPSYTYENEVYPQFAKELTDIYKPAFLIIRKNNDENKVHLSEEMKAFLKNSEMFLVVFENENQISNEKSFIYNDLKEAFGQKIIRGFNSDDVVSYDETKFMYRYYQWYNSVLERNTTFLNVNMLKNPDTVPDDNLALTLKAVEELMDKTEKLGYSFPNKGTEIPYRFNLRTSAMCGAVVLIALLYLYIMLIAGKKADDRELYFLILCTVLIIFSFAFFDVITKYYALLIMILTASLITLILFKLHISCMPFKSKLAAVLICPVALITAGAISVTALISDFDFFLGDKWFFGVIISLTVPVILTLFNYYAVYIGSKEKCKEFFDNLKNSLKKVPVYIIVSIAVLITAFAAYYLIRTGKSDLILPIEDKIRKFLTDLFIIRPRFKEFLIGYPAFTLFVYFGFFRKNKSACTVFGILQIILFTSVLNTFCHAFTLLWVNSLRVITGFATGIVFSGIIIAILEIIYFASKKQTSKKN